MILDSHMHLGEDLMFNTDDDEAAILSYLDENGIDGALLQTGILPRDPRAANERVYRMIQDHPGRFWGAAVLSPYLPEEDYRDFMRWAVRGLGFRALKLQAYGFCASPVSPQARKVFETARELDVPVIIHTGNGVPAALPAYGIAAAQRYPDLNIVLAHSGGGMYGGEALIAAQTCKNIYLETSWCTIYDLKSFVETLGCERIMFGTDLPMNAPVELAKYRALKLTDRQYERCFFGTANEVFRLI